MTLYRSLLAWLAALSADPAEIDREPPQAAAAVAAAYATFASDAVPAPPAPPLVKVCGCSGKCQSGQYRPDGKIVIQCDRECACACRKSK